MKKKKKILILLKLLSLHLWQAAHCKLHNAKCTVDTAPAPANAPVSAPVHFILHIEHSTFHAKHLY